MFGLRILGTFSGSPALTEMLALLADDDPSAHRRDPALDQMELHDRVVGLLTILAPSR